MVEWKKLVSVADVLYGYPFESSLFSEESKYIPLIRIRDVKPGKASTYYSGEVIEDYLIKKGDILVGMDGEFNLGKWDDRDGLLNQRVLKLKGKDGCSINGYLFHYMGPVFKRIEQTTAGGSVKHLSAKIIKDIEIPLPSLSEQERIVGILDTFTSSIENLKAQISLRRKQYEHYRDKLLDLEGKPGVEMKTLGEVCDFIRGPFGGALKKEIFVNEGYAIYEQQHAIYGEWSFRYFIDEKKFSEMKRFEVKPGDILMSCSGTMGKTSIVPSNCIKGIINQALLKLTTRDILDNKFLKKYMDSQWFQDGLKKQVAGGAIQNVASVSILKDLIIPLPPLQEQSRIVSILDEFEASIKNLEAQLEAREKQYEYYRNKLLTFE